MNQMSLPLSLEDFIPENHLVRVVNKVVDKLELSSLYNRYKHGGCPAYHPKMMLKVMIYSYSQRSYSSRQIAKALRENISFIWLSGNNRPDFRTINRFRLDMREVIEEVFYDIVRLLIDGKYINMETYFLDGTKIEANASKYSFVWKKSTLNYDRKLDEKIRKHLSEIDSLVAEENALYGDKDLEEMGEDGRISADQAAEIAEGISKKLEQNPADKRLKKHAGEFKKEILPRKRKYEKQLGIFEERNSYSKTDTDATFMRMKEDAMLNGQLKPGYNVQIGTENRFILGYTIHRNPADTKTMIPHLERVEASLGTLPQEIVADAGYGSEENYEYLEDKRLTGYVKYNKFHWEKKKQNRDNPFLAEHFPYDAESDSFSCPNGMKLRHLSRRKYTTEAGYETLRDLYRCDSCDECPYACQCKKTTGVRVIRVSHRLNELKSRANENLCSARGLALRSRRPVEVEQVFGRLKGNWSFRRFLLRGMEKVKIEFGLLAIAHNLTKMTTPA